MTNKGIRTPGNADSPARQPEASPDQPAEEHDEEVLPAVASRYWLVILIWAIGFAIMIVFEIIASIWRR